jgi:hypothetical protein
MTTLGFIDQLNQGKTDRQFLYFQHSCSVIRKINIFGSFEIDLYNQSYDSIDSTYNKSGKAKLTNLYVSFTYRIIKQLSVSFSYSARKNIIYYETYKNSLERLLDEATLQGYMVQVQARPIDKLSVGITGSYRFKKDEDPRRTKNIYGYISYSQVPGVGITPTLSYTWLETSYLQGQIYSIGISRDFLKGKVATGLSYRYVDYDFTYTENNLPQNMFEIDLTWRMIRKLALSVYYEGTFEAVEKFNRIYAQINYRF